MWKTPLSALTILAGLAVVPAAVVAPSIAASVDLRDAPNPLRSGYVEANGVHYYYEVHGQGEPLLLLHGGLGSIDMFGPLLPALAEGREVIGVDLHGHGRTRLGDRSIDYMDLGDDLAIVLSALGYDQGTSWATRSVAAPRSASRSSTRPWCAGWWWYRRGSPGMATTLTCCPCRRR
jgi:hypothetical protein